MICIPVISCRLTSLAVWKFRSAHQRIEPMSHSVHIKNNVISSIKAWTIYSYFYKLTNISEAWHRPFKRRVITVFVSNKQGKKILLYFLNVSGLQNLFLKTEVLILSVWIIKNGTQYTFKNSTLKFQKKKCRVV